MCVCVCGVHVFVCTCFYMCGVHLSVYVHVFPRVYISSHVCIVFLCACTCLSRCVHVFPWVYISFHVCAHAFPCVSEENLSAGPRLLPLRQEPLCQSPLLPNRSRELLGDSLVSCFRLAVGVLELQTHAAMPGFYVDSGNFNSGPHGWPARALTREGNKSSLQPRFFFFFQKEKCLKKQHFTCKTHCFEEEENFINL